MFTEAYQDSHQKGGGVSILFLLFLSFSSLNCWKNKYLKNKSSRSIVQGFGLCHSINLPTCSLLVLRVKMLTYENAHTVSVGRCCRDSAELHFKPLRGSLPTKEVLYEDTKCTSLVHTNKKLRYILY